jgi:hypothetical protein
VQEKRYSPRLMARSVAATRRSVQRLVDERGLAAYHGQVRKMPSWSKRWASFSRL